MTSIRSPFETISGCYYLARLTDKVRLELLGLLPDDYRLYLFHKYGADTRFLNYFELTREELVDAVKASNNDDSRVATWFEQRTNLDDTKRKNWNDFAVNLGKQGHPMSKTFQWAREHLMRPCSDPKVDTVFKAIDWDEGRL